MSPQNGIFLLTLVTSDGCVVLMRYHVTHVIYPTLGFQLSFLVELQSLRPCEYEADIVRDPTRDTTDDDAVSDRISTSVSCTPAWSALTRSDAIKEGSISPLFDATKTFTIHFMMFAFYA